MAIEHRRIAKNTIYLYVRMILVLGVSLYTSRALLHALGIVNLGVYNLIAGVVVSLSFLNSSLAGAASRFITFALGKGNIDLVRKYYGTLRLLHTLLALLLLFAIGLVGSYLVYSWLDIPPNNRSSALVLLYLSSASMAVSILSVPDNSLLIANERMDVYAYISMIEVALKLLAVIAIQMFGGDKLINYGLFLLIVQLFVRLMYFTQAQRLYSSQRSRARYSAEVGREVFSYVGWNASGTLSVIGYTQGLNILLNLFFGPVVNAARGFAVQIQSSVENIILGFQTAVRPQIVKSYASGELEEMHELVIQASKYGYYLTLLIVVPLLISLKSILLLWLGEIPTYTLGMATVFLLMELISPLKIPLLSAIHATGDIKKFQICEGAVLLMVVPVSYILLKYVDASPIGVIVGYLVIELIAQLIRLRVVSEKVGLSIRYYIKNLLPALGVFALIVLIGYLVYSFNYIGFLGIVINTLIIEVALLVVIGSIGITGKERQMAYQQIKKKLCRK